MAVTKIKLLENNEVLLDALCLRIFKEKNDENRLSNENIMNFIIDDLEIFEEDRMMQDNTINGQIICENELVDVFNCKVHHVGHSFEKNETKLIIELVK